MATILRVDSSPRIQGSHSRELGDYFENLWLHHHPKDVVVRRDVGVNPPPVPLDDLIKAHFAVHKRGLTEKEKEVIALSDELEREYIEADILLLTVPMYNFSPPASFKTWLDHIVRKGSFFGFKPDGEITGLLSDEKRIYVMAAYGLPYKGQPWASSDYMYGVIASVFEFCGIPKVNLHYVSAEGTARADLKQACKTQAKKQIDTLIAQSLRMPERSGSGVSA
jgi:FMN-dependent NADH-azoreductase